MNNSQQSSCKSDLTDRVPASPIQEGVDKAQRLLHRPRHMVCLFTSPGVFGTNPGQPSLPSKFCVVNYILKLSFRKMIASVYMK